MKTQHPVSTLATVLLIGAFILTGCESELERDVAESASEVSVDQLADPLLEISTFKGTIPCASCPGIEMSLQLKPDGTFFLQSLYLDVDGGEDRLTTDLGRWARTVGGDMLILRGGTEGARRWAAVGNDTLRMLNNLAEPIESDLAYDLVRSDDTQHLSATGRMSGMYTYMADAALFEECQTRKRYPVVFEEAHIDLERAYLEAREEPGKPLKTTFDGRIELRPVMEGDGEREFVVVSAFDAVMPGEACLDQEMPLDETIWNLIELNGRPVKFSDKTRIPHIVLASEDNLATGSGGCNRFTGSYSVSADSLSFGQMASTMMACQDDMGQESAFLDALSATTNHDLYGNKLELWAEDRVLARFEGTVPKKSIQ